MRYSIYEDPVTHRFALVALPRRFVEGDPVPVRETEQWFASRDEAVAAVPGLLNRDEREPCVDAECAVTAH